MFQSNLYHIILLILNPFQASLSYLQSRGGSLTNDDYAFALSLPVAPTGGSEPLKTETPMEPTTEENIPMEATNHDEADEGAWTV